MPRIVYSLETVLLSRKEFVPMEISSAESQADTMSILPDKTSNGSNISSSWYFTTGNCDS